MGLTRSQVTAWGDGAITVHALAPACVPTGMTASPPSHFEIALRLRRRDPIGRCGRLEALDFAALRLVSAARSFLTGVVSPLAGGWR